MNETSSLMENIISFSVRPEDEMNENWMNNHATIYECKRYEPSDGGDGQTCLCGIPRSEHVEEVFSESQRPYAYKPSNAYGNFFMVDGDFRSPKPIRYARYCHRFGFSHVMDMMTRWKIVDSTRPTFILSLIGNITEDPWRKEYDCIEQLLMHLAENMDLVVIVDGIDCRLTRNIHKMLRRISGALALSIDDFQPPRLVGFLPWKTLYDNTQLINKGETINYDVTDCKHSSTSQRIFPHLTHLFLVDMYKPGRYPDTSWPITFSRIRLNLFYETVTINSMTVVWGGELELCEGINQETILTLKGTGGIADVMSMAMEKYSIYQNWDDVFEDNNKELLLEIDKLCQSENNEKVKEILGALDDSLINVFDIKSEKSLFDTICNCCLNKLKSDEQRIQYAVLWNRKDVFSTFECQVKQDENTNAAFFMALTENRSQFINKFIEMYPQVLNSITLECLHRLYNETNASNELFGFFESIQLIHQRTNKLTKPKKTNISSVLGYTIENKASENPLPNETIYLSDIYNFLNSTFAPAYIPEYLQDSQELKNRSELDEIVLTNPIWHLVIWAALMNWHEMTEKLIKLSPRPLGITLLASSIHSKRASMVPAYDTEARRVYIEEANFFENIASEVFENIGNQYEQGASEILNETHPFLYEQTLQWITIYNNKIGFACSAPYQEYIDKKWNFGFTSNTLVLFLTCLCPFLLKWDQIQSWCRREDSPIKGMNLFEGTMQLYKAPRVKHMFFFLEYLAFLMLLSYALIFDLPPNRMGLCEFIAVCFYAVLAIVVFLEFIKTGVQSTFKNAYLKAATTPLFTFNLITYVWNIIYFFLRATSFVKYDDIRILFAVLLIICYLRLFDFLANIREFGPLIVIIMQMLKEYMAILVLVPIILVPFGISLQVLLFPNIVTFNWETFANVFELPFYNMFGELALDDIRGEREDCEPDGITCPLKNWFALVLHFFFICSGAILLMNLLIAVFSAVYTKLYQNSYDYWKFYRLPITNDYNSRSHVPVPFSIITIPINILIAWINRCKKSKYMHLNKVDEDTAYVKCEDLNLLEVNFMKVSHSNRKNIERNTVSGYLTAALNEFQSHADQLLNSMQICTREFQKEQEKTIKSVSDITAKQMTFLLDVVKIKKEVETDLVDEEEKQLIAELAEVNKNLAKFYKDLSSIIDAMKVQRNFTS